VKKGSQACTRIAVITSVPFRGTRKVEPTLRAGTYTYQCDPHAASGMKATFRGGDGD
jgi:plastocyanin